MKVKTSFHMPFSMTCFLHDDLFFKYLFLASIIIIHVVRYSQISYVSRTWLIIRFIPYVTRRVPLALGAGISYQSGTHEFTTKSCLLGPPVLICSICCWTSSRIIICFFILFWSMVQRGSDTSLTNWCSLLLYIQ